MIWMYWLFLRMQLVGADLRQMLTVYCEAAWLLPGGLMRTTAVSGELGRAEARVGAPACGVRIVMLLPLGTVSPDRVMPTAVMVSASGRTGRTGAVSCAAGNSARRGRQLEVTKGMKGQPVGGQQQVRKAHQAAHVPKHTHATHIQ